MADVKISALPLASTPLTGTEVLPIVQSATTDQVTVANLTAGRAVSASSLTLTTTPLAVGSGGTGLTSLTTGYIPFGAGTSAFGNSSNLFWDSANNRLGIGTASPGQTLNVASSANNMVARFWGTSYGLTFNSDASSGFRIEATDPTGGVSYQKLILSGSSQAFNIAGSAAMTLDASGNLGISDTSPSSWGKLSVIGNATLNLSSGAYISSIGTISVNSLNNGVNNSAAIVLRAYPSGGGTHAGILSQESIAGVDYRGNTCITYMADSAGGSFRVRQFNPGTNTTSTNLLIDASGNLLVGTSGGVGKTTIVDAANQPTVYAQNTNASYTSDGFTFRPSRDTTNGSFFAYSYYNVGAAAYRFYVTDAGRVYGTGAYVDLSDVSQKENIRDLELGLTSILSLKPRRFNWREGVGDGQDNKIGFIAQEVEEVLPDVVNDWGDRNAPLKGVAISEITPVLVKAIQELSAKVEALEAKVA